MLKNTYVDIFMSPARLSEADSLSWVNPTHWPALRTPCDVRPNPSSDARESSI